MLTCFNVGIPPANISPNCGTIGAPEGGCGTDEGAPICGGALVVDPLTVGADLSFVTAFLSFIPLWMSLKRAFLPAETFGNCGGRPPDIIGGGGGGGGGGGPAIGWELYER